MNDQMYQFRHVTWDDAPLLRSWLAQPHVKEWWEEEEPFGVEDYSDPRVARWLVSYDGNPFAYMQDYTVHGWDDHYFYALPEGSRGIDQYIGVPEMTGLGHGTRFMAARLRALFEEGAPVVATDPHPDNTRAIAAYKKVGFEVFGEPIHSKWGVILPMKIERSADLPKDE